MKKMNQLSRNAMLLAALPTIIAGCSPKTEPKVTPSTVPSTAVAPAPSTGPSTTVSPTSPSVTAAAPPIKNENKPSMPPPSSAKISAHTAIVPPTVHTAAAPPPPAHGPVTIQTGIKATPSLVKKVDEIKTAAAADNGKVTWSHDDSSHLTVTTAAASDDAHSYQLVTKYLQLFTQKRREAGLPEDKAVACVVSIFDAKGKKVGEATPNGYWPSDPSALVRKPATTSPSPDNSKKKGA